MAGGSHPWVAWDDGLFNGWLCRYQNTTPLKAGMVVSNEPGVS